MAGNHGFGVFFDALFPMFRNCLSLERWIPLRRPAREWRAGDLHAAAWGPSNCVIPLVPGSGPPYTVSSRGAQRAEREKQRGNCCSPVLTQRDGLPTLGRHKQIPRRPRLRRELLGMTHLSGNRRLRKAANMRQLFIRLRGRHVNRDASWAVTHKSGSANSVTPSNCAAFRSKV